MTDQKTQAEKFKDAAEQLVCDPDEKRWEERLRVIATRHPEADELSPEDGPQATG